VASYPSIVYGAGNGYGSPGTVLPLEVSALTCVTSSWNVTTTNTGYWDAAYDIWFCPNKGLSSNSAELMIWMDYMPGTEPAGSLQAANVSIGGQKWDVYEGNIGWNYIAYLAEPSITAFNNENIYAFIQDSCPAAIFKTPGTLQTSRQA